jgi:hypothetical protein
MAGRLVLPHSFRVAGVFFLLYLALGHLPALFALPAGLGDIAAGIAAPLVARRLSQGTGRRAALWFNVYGLTDLAVAITLGALTGSGVLNVTPSTAPISELPLALVIAADVPLMIALHITSLVTLRGPQQAQPAVARPDADHRSSGPQLRNGGKEGTLPGRRTWTRHGVALLGSASRAGARHAEGPRLQAPCARQDGRHR